MSLVEWQDSSIDSPRPIRVIIIGAGPSGIICAIRLRQRLNNVSFQIYEKNADFGGTWYEHRYPGVGCDIPVLSYQLTFEPNRGWSSFYPPGKEIGEYWKYVGRKYKLYESTKFSHQVSRAEWDSRKGKWRVQVDVDSKKSTINDEADFLICCVGQFSNWKWPDIVGRERFQGKVIHTARWDTSYSLEGKKVAVIGSGGSAVQVVPKIQPIVGHLDIYIRNQLWVSPRFGADYIQERNPEVIERNFVLTDDLRRRFIEDPTFYNEYRKGMEQKTNSLHGFTLRDHPLQKMFRDFMTTEMQQKLKERPEIYEKLLPTFPAGCRRVTPGVGFLEALVEDNVSLETREIRRFTERGMETSDGEFHNYDTIICATGYDCSFRPSFPFIGQNNVDLRDKFKDRPRSYMSLAVDGFPNMIMVGGPNSEVGTSHSMIVFEKICDYAIKCVGKVQFERIRSMTPSSQAVNDFMSYVDVYFQNERTVYGERCRSAYRNGAMEGPSTALWPGSVLHLIRTIQEPRWQDFEYEYLEENIFGYLGNGWTDIEKNGADLAYYLDHIDYPSIPE